MDVILSETKQISSMTPDLLYGFGILGCIFFIAFFLAWFVYEMMKKED